MPVVGDRPAASLGRAVSFFSVASGFAALVYEILWLKELGLLFGNTAHASAIGFGVFFAGLAAGSHFWGRRDLSPRRALITYAWMEIGIAAAATLYFGLLAAYRAIYAPLFDVTAHAPGLFTAARIALAAGVLFPPAFLMGGTVPVLGHLAIARAETIGRLGARLYALNTAGAAAGALAAGFYLPAALGFRGAYAVAMAINVLIAGVAFALARRIVNPASDTPRQRDTAAARHAHATHAARDRHALAALAVASGCLTLALEVTATRLFAQVLQNSVYTFATILVVFLIALSAGSWIASRLAIARVDPWRTLAVLLLLVGASVAAVPFVFHRLTGGLQYIGGGQGWTAYLGGVFQLAFLVLALPCTLAGIVFPFLLRLAQDAGTRAGRTLGTLSAWNTAGAVAGSTGSGFVLLPLAGMWGALQAIAAVYLLVALLTLQRTTLAVSPVRRALPALGLVLCFTVFDPRTLPLVRLDAAAGERLLDVRESPYGITAVVEREGDRRIKVNNYYSLGGSGSVEHERNQALLPLMAHPRPRSVFVIGMGTGITAGAARQPAVERLTVAELIPDVIAAARHHFAPLTNGLFADPRARILSADGRHHLAATRERYDLIVADLFVPWEAGTGSLYTREHFTTVRDRLHDAGVFVQWLPLYQMSRSEFMTIARTMLTVFPDVTLWRGDFFPERPIVALAGSVRTAPLDPGAIAARGREISGGRVSPEAARALTLPFYAGHLSRARHLVPDGPLNTDDRPVVEYAAPVTQREQRAGTATWFHSLDLLAFFRDLQDAAPPEDDPYLSRVDVHEREWVRAGLDYHAAAIHRATGRTDLAEAAMRAFEARMPRPLRPAGGDEPADRRDDWDPRP